MESPNNFCAVNLAALLVFVLISACVQVSASAERTKTVEFNVKPGGVVHTFSQGISQTAAAGQSDVPLKPEEFTVGDSTVTHTSGKFNAQLSKLTAIGRTRHDEL
eukprot:superscaffoldBa00002110_g13211